MNVYLSSFIYDLSTQRQDVFTHINWRQNSVRVQRLRSVLVGCRLNLVWFGFIQESPEKVKVTRKGPQIDVLPFWVILLKIMVVFRVMVMACILKMWIRSHQTCLGSNTQNLITVSIFWHFLIFTVRAIHFIMIMPSRDKLVPVSLHFQFSAQNCVKMQQMHRQARKTKCNNWSFQ